MSTQRRTILRSLCAAACSVVFAVLTVHGTASAKVADDTLVSPTANPFILQIAERQSRLLPIANRVSSIASQASSGLGGIYLDPERETVTAYWKGAIPTALLDEQRTALTQGVTLTVAPALHTFKELTAEVARLADVTSPGVGIAIAARVESVTPRFDGSGIVVGVSGIPGNLGGDLLSLLPGLSSSIPVEIAPGAPAIPAFRNNDRAPFRGGARILRSGYACTSGFGVVNQSNNTQYLLTSNHCGNGNWTTGDGVTLGYTDGYAFDRDAMLVRVSTATNRIWDGPHYTQTSGQFTKPVIGTATNYAGMYTCNSGAYSGAICYMRVVSTGGVTNMTGYGQVVDIVTADNINGTSAGGNGDSGGPQFLLNSDTSAVYALGTLSAYPSDQSFWVPCVGVPGVANSQIGRHCARRIFYPDVNRQMILLRDITGRSGLRIMR